MGQYIYSVLLVAMLLSSCKADQPNNSVVDSTFSEMSGSSVESGDLKEAKNCDEFLEEYEKWTIDYLAIIDKYMKNPMDAELMNKYMKLAENSMTWMTQWNSNLVLCASQEKYEKKFNKITQRVEEKLKELGIE